MARWVAWLALLFVAPLAAAPTAAEPALSFPVTLISDSSGDAKVPPDLPVGPFDVRKLVVLAEDPEALYLALELGPFVVDQAAPLTQVPAGAVEITFAIANMTFSLQITLNRDLGANCAASFCLNATSRGLMVSVGDRPPFWGSPINLELDDEKDRLLFRFARSAMSGGYWGQAFGIKAPLGTQLKDLIVVTHGPTQGQQEPAANFDRAPDSGFGAPYALQTHPPSTILQLHFEGDAENLPVGAGTNQSFRFAVANLAPEKRLINLSYKVTLRDPYTWQPLDAGGKLLVYGPSSIVLPGGRWRNYTVSVVTRSDINDGFVGDLNIRAEGGEAGDVAFLHASLHRGMVLGPEQNRLYAHGTLYEDALAPALHCQYPAPIPFTGCYAWGYLSEKKEETPGEESLPLWLAVGASPSAFPTPLGSRRLIAEPVAFGENGVVHVEFTAKSEGVPLDAQMIVTALASVGSQRSEVLVTKTTDVSLTSTPSPFTFDLRLADPEFRVFPVGTRFTLTVLLNLNDQRKVDAAIFSSRTTIDSKSVEIRLPVVELPEEYREIPVVSPFQTSYGGEREEFVNPGKSRLLNVTVTNVDASEQRLIAEALLSAPGWSATILPGNTFQLPAGLAVTVGVLVTAPPSATEGEGTNVTFRAVADDGSARIERIVVTATQGGTLPDDKDAFVGDEDEKGLLVTPSKKDTPQMPVLLILAAIAGVAIRRRR